MPIKTEIAIEAETHSPNLDSVPDEMPFDESEGKLIGLITRGIAVRRDRKRFQSPEHWFTVSCEAELPPLP